MFYGKDEGESLKYLFVIMSSINFLNLNICISIQYTTSNSCFYFFYRSLQLFVFWDINYLLLCLIFEDQPGASRLICVAGTKTEAVIRKNGFIIEFGKRDNFCSNYDKQQLSVIVDFTTTTLPLRADICSRESIVFLKLFLFFHTGQLRVTFVLEALFPAYVDVFEILFLELSLNHVMKKSYIKYTIIWR